MAERLYPAEIVQRSWMAAANGHVVSRLAGGRKHRKAAAEHGKEDRVLQEGTPVPEALDEPHSSPEVPGSHWVRGIHGAGSCTDLNVVDTWVTPAPLEVEEQCPRVPEDWMGRVQEDGVYPKETWAHPGDGEACHDRGHTWT